MAASKGDSYTYVVEKFWIVDRVTADNQVCLRTARGKTNFVALNDPNLRRPSWLQRFIWRARFRAVEDNSEQAGFAT